VIAGHELRVVVVEVEVKRILQVGVDRQHLRRDHGELAEPDRATLEIDVVLGRYRQRQGLRPRVGRRAEHLYHLVTFDPHSGELTRRPGRRQAGKGIEEQVVAIHPDAARATQIEQVLQPAANGGEQLLAIQPGDVHSHRVDPDELDVRGHSLDGF